MPPFWKSLIKGIRKKKSARLRPEKFCPQCRNPTLVRTSIGSWLSTESYRCTYINCEYEGAFYLEVDPEEDGKNLLDLEELKLEFPEDLDPETEFTLDPDLLQKTHTSTSNGQENV